MRMPYLAFLTALMALIGVSLSPTSVDAQDQMSAEDMREMQRMLNDPAFQQQMREAGEMMEEMMKDPAFRQQMEQHMGGNMQMFQPEFFSGLGNYMQCLTDGMGSDWMATMAQRMQPYMEHVQGLCQRGRQSAAAAFVNDQRNAERLFSPAEMHVLDRCEAQFPDQSMLRAGASDNATGAEVCEAFAN